MGKTGKNFDNIDHQIMLKLSYKEVCKANKFIANNICKWKAFSIDANIKNEACETFESILKSFETYNLYISFINNLAINKNINIHSRNNLINKLIISMKKIQESVIFACKIASKVTESFNDAMSVEIDDQTINLYLMAIMQESIEVKMLCEITANEAVANIDYIKNNFKIYKSGGSKLAA